MQGVGSAVKELKRLSFRVWMNLHCSRVWGLSYHNGSQIENRMEKAMGTGAQ